MASFMVIRLNEARYAVFVLASSAVPSDGGGDVVVVAHTFRPRRLRQSDLLQDECREAVGEGFIHLDPFAQRPHRSSGAVGSAYNSSSFPPPSIAAEANATTPSATNAKAHAERRIVRAVRIEGLFSQPEGPVPSATLERKKRRMAAGLGSPCRSRTVGALAQIGPDSPAGRERQAHAG